MVVSLNSTSNVSTIGEGPGNGNEQFSRNYDLFIRSNRLYVIDFLNNRVQKISLNGSSWSTVPGVSAANKPYCLYIDMDNNLYLSDSENNRVLLFPSNGTNFTVVAGTGLLGNNTNQLNKPYGVFVTRMATIYVADCLNHRIMKWFQGALTGIVIAGNGTRGMSSTQLACPTQVILDTNEFMYISENGNSRITRWAPYASFGECIIACTGVAGIGLNQLKAPHSLNFDRHGSLYVSDRANNRIQKFQILPYRSKY